MFVWPYKCAANCKNDVREETKKLILWHDNLSIFRACSQCALSPQRSEKKMVKRNRSSRKLVKSSAKIELITIRKKSYISWFDILLRQITTFIKVHVAFILGLQTLKLIDFSKSYQLRGLKSKNKGHTNTYECCDLT